jgi:hypothetical protein
MLLMDPPSFRVCIQPSIPLMWMLKMFFSVLNAGRQLVADASHALGHAFATL